MEEAKWVLTVGKRPKKTVRMKERAGKWAKARKSKWTIIMCPVPEVRQEIRTSSVYSYIIKSLANHIPTIIIIFIASRLDGIKSGIS